MNSLKRNRNGNITFISPLYKWASFCLQTPPYDFNKKMMLNTYWFRLATILYIVSIIFATLLTFYSKSLYLVHEKGVPLTAKIIDSLLLIVQVITCILISSTALCQSNDIKLLIKTFEMLDSRLNIDEENKGMQTYNFTIEIILVHVLYLTTATYEAYVWNSRNDFKFYLMLLLKTLLFYPYVLLSLILWNFILAIKVRFKLLNKQLRKYSLPAFHLNVYSISMKNTKEIRNKINFHLSNNKILQMKDILKLHRHLSDLIELFNKIYGCKIFLMTVIFILGALMAVSLGLSFGISGNFVGGNYGINLFILCNVLWPTVTLVNNF